MIKLNIPPSERRIFTVSNFFTISRLLLLPFIIWVLKQPVNPKNNVLLAGMILFAIASDFLDGYFARRLNQVSTIGKIIDPLADKICIGVMLVFLTLYRNFPLWLAIGIISRDILIILASLLLISKLQQISMSNLVGKVTVFLFSLLILSYLFTVDFVKTPLTVLAIAGIFLSTFSYARRFFLLWRGGKMGSVEA